MVPVLLGVGALAGTGGMSLALALGAALAASLPPDLVWYELGRRRGGRILGLLCRVSLEPDSCVRRAENLGWWPLTTGGRGRAGGTRTLEEVEREHIRAVLELTGWRVSGERGAAEHLGMKPTTLEARMKRLGITRKE